MLERGDERWRETDSVDGEHGAGACNNALRRLPVALGRGSPLMVDRGSRPSSDLVEMSGKRAHRVGRHRLERREECPLVRVRLETLWVQKDRRVRLPPLALKRQRD